MAEYIEKNVAIVRLTALEIGVPCATMTDAKRQIADTPAADVAPVVRCKDCKYADSKKESVTEKRYADDILFCRNSEFCGDEPLAMWPDDFCSYGKRKDIGDNDAVNRC